MTAPQHSREQRDKAAARTRKARALAKAGRAVLAVEVDLWELSDFLVQARLLEGWHAEDKIKIREALEVAISLLCRDDRLSDCHARRI